MRPRELHKALPKLRRRVLAQLKELVVDGLVSKTIYHGLPLRSEHSITRIGCSLLPILDTIIDWDKENQDLFAGKYNH